MILFYGYSGYYFPVELKAILPLRSNLIFVTKEIEENFQNIKHKILQNIKLETENGNIPVRSFYHKHPFVDV